MSRAGVDAGAGSGADSVQAVLVDLDDTLFDHAHSTRAGIAALRGAFAAFGGLAVEELTAINARHLEAIHLRVLSGELSLEQARALRFRMVCDDCGAPELDSAAVSACYRAAYLGAQRAVPGARELLAALRARGVKIAVVTNNVVAEQVAKLALLDLRALVDVLVVSEEAGAYKPDPEIFRIALARCGVAAARAVMLGDSWDNDVAGARAAGIRAVWLNRHGHPRVDASCPQVADLLPTAPLIELLLGASPG